ncbi:hypothetical protein [Candidatus Nanohalobium constans]|uniref:Uncharacterized protein n=1 Tax=Candidatus Nanohalobium constans TaxID=2565781 RepID=A0A5Q0UF11_9ARCH|nr:hypothetical protein [Candidatus Nanohalobium constans]QGA80147.1 hypothetical protein LC1Nh_0243 [Candidatus Nanohalobium constans]
MGIEPAKESVAVSEPQWKTDVIENGGDPSAHELEPRDDSPELDYDISQDSSLLQDNTYLVRKDSEGFDVLLAVHEDDTYLDENASPNDLLEYDSVSHHELTSMVSSAERDRMPREIGKIVSEYVEELDEGVHVI